LSSFAQKTEIAAARSAAKDAVVLTAAILLAAASLSCMLPAAHAKRFPDWPLGFVCCAWLAFVAALACMATLS